MIKEYLSVLLERDYFEPTMPLTIKNILENFDDDQINYLLSTGLKISNDLTLYYQNGVGFRCMNENINIIGRKPVCNIIAKTLNNKLLKS